MTKWHLRSGRKTTGGKLQKGRKKRRSDRGFMFVETKIGKREVAKSRIQGGSMKLRLSSADQVNVADPDTGKIKRAKIVSVKENKANPHYVRRNILTKGALVETDAGTARITSRPGQQGMLNAVSVKEKK